MYQPDSVSVSGRTANTRLTMPPNTCHYQGKRRLTCAYDGQGPSRLSAVVCGSGRADAVDTAVDGGHGDTAARPMHQP